MIYTKLKAKDGKMVQVAVTGKNTYTRCKECGREIQISLRDPVLSNVENPFEPDMLCADCTEKRMGRADFQQERPLVYICSPYSGDVKRNVEAAQRYCRIAVDRGYMPIAPHLLYPQFMNDDDPAERKLGMSFGNVLMERCSELWVCGERLSEGMKAEFDRASALGKTIKFIREAVCDA